MDGRQIDKLLTRISRGDNAAFAELYEKTRRGVFSFLYSYLKNYEDTEDAMQTVYLKVKLNATQYRRGTNGRAWMLQIAKNLALNELKARERALWEEPPGEATEPSETIEPALSLGITDVMNRVLTEEERYVVNLHVLWGYKHREIAKEMHCPTGTVTSKYKRSISKLKTALKEEEE